VVDLVAKVHLPLRELVAVEAVAVFGLAGTCLLQLSVIP
jgi:hypothetical protein